MFFAIATVALLAFTQATGATPFKSTATPVSPIAQGINVAAHFPIHNIGGLAASPATKATLSTTGVHPDAANGIFPALLLLCENSNCLDCSAYDLSATPENECFLDTSSSFNSVAIDQQSNEGLPFTVVVGLNNTCATFSQIPAVNQCFNLPDSGPPFTDFAVIG